MKINQSQKLEIARSHVGEGVPMEDIQKWLGHFEITTTEGIYAHFDDTQNVKTLAKISEALDGKPSQGEMK